MNQISRIKAQYVNKMNVFTQTETGKYSFMTAEEGLYTNESEWALKRNLEDAELLIQEHLSNNADQKDEML